MLDPFLFDHFVICLISDDIFGIFHSIVTVVTYLDILLCLKCFGKIILEDTICVFRNRLLISKIYLFCYVSASHLTCCLVVAQSLIFSWLLFNSKDGINMNESNYIQLTTTLVRLADKWNLVHFSLTEHPCSHNHALSLKTEWNFNKLEEAGAWGTTDLLHYQKILPQTW